MYKVVVFDDEEMIRFGVSTILSGFRDVYQIVGEAGDGKEGYRLIESLKPDIVITDIRMPNGGGLEILRKVQESGLHCKVMILTAYSDFDYARSAIRYGADSYLLKPIHADELISELKRIIGVEIHPKKIEPEDEAAKELLDGILSKHSDLHPIVYKTIKIIARDFKNVKLNDISNELKVTAAYVCDLFKRNMGVNFVSFLNEFKINLAQRLLLEYNYKIHEVSSRAGFSNPKYFNKVFTDIVHTTPTEFLAANIKKGFI